MTSEITFVYARMTSEIMFVVVLSFFLTRRHVQPIFMILGSAEQRWIRPCNETCSAHTGLVANLAVAPGQRGPSGA